MTVRTRFASRLCAILALSTVMAFGQTTNVKIIQRQTSETTYSYVVPGHFNSTTNTDVNCNVGSSDVNCSGETATNGTSTAPGEISYTVTGATFSLLLPDGRVAVVNCGSKGKSFMRQWGRNIAETGKPESTEGPKRSCRIPLVDDIQVEFKGRNAKLRWPVSIDGKKFEAETYTILAVLGKESKLGQ
jgi:hypothetical protein